MTIFPTWYPDKWSADSTDKVWASDGVTNFNITVDEIGNEVFIDRSTTDLAEWTNEYYTEAKVSANATVVAKADKTNVLELDNTTVYTPDADYEPATKRYVDDSIVSLIPKTWYSSTYSTELASKTWTSVTTQSVETTVLTFTAIYEWDVQIHINWANNGNSNVYYRVKINWVLQDETLSSWATFGKFITLTNISVWDEIQYTIEILWWTTTEVTSDANLNGGFIFSPSFT